ncbi:OB-fold domain-containing protein [Sciscionella sediminilitoris]|uniref:OB-fold domain-containing protein n=1 Tax=Sciscionella sediminilitoris TaxID=1445613 RepID=UPI0004DF5546|nr:OB-fold domain-containing protein [Sciscionella sp. SE31]
MSGKGILAYASHLPVGRLWLDELGAALGTGAGSGTRPVASFDEDSTTMGVEAASALLHAHPAEPGSVYFATSSPVYADKTNATTVHAAVALPETGFAADVAGSARSGVAACRAAASCDGLAVLADIRTGKPGSVDESAGADGSVALLFGPASDSLAEIRQQHSLSVEILDRWREPGSMAAAQWEERFGFEAYLPLLRRVAMRVLDAEGIEQADHVVLTSPNREIRKRGVKVVTGTLSTETTVAGHAGAADVGLAIADALDRAEPGETILVLQAADGCDALLLRTTSLLADRRQPTPLRARLGQGNKVSYLTYLSWRGWLEREPPRRPEPERPAGPPSARGRAWKFSFTGSVCASCEFVHLPPARVCKRCGSSAPMASRSLAGAGATVATYTVDRLAFSPSPPLVEAVVDFDGGGRYTLEVADAQQDALAVGTRVGLSFRRLFTAGGVHNYFWKARVPADGAASGVEQEHSDGGRQ